MDLLIFENEENIRAGFTEKPDRAAERRRLMAEAAEEKGGFVLRPLLVHGTRVQKIDRAFLTQARAEGASSYAELPETDGLVTDLPGVVLTSTHGDCIPVWAFDPEKRVIGLAHAGWKGTLNGIAAELIRVMQQEYGCRAESILTYIGPGIDLCHFEVGPEVAVQFREKSPEFGKYVHDRPDGKSMIDLKGINRLLLAAARVKNIAVSTECTYCEEERYYSYRRCKDSERMLAYIELL